MRLDTPDVWVGIKSCGCCVAVVTDTGDRHTEEAKRYFLREGLSVVRKTWQEWQDTEFGHCKHLVPEPKQDSLFAVEAK